MYAAQNGGQPLAVQHAELLSALSNPARLQVVNATRQREINVSELCDICGLSQSAVSQHLSRLRAAGLVSIRREHQCIYYRLASDEVTKLLATLEELYHAKSEISEHLPPLP
jgi:DNA-binding transcriptional ArsR family regulator